MTLPFPPVVVRQTVSLTFGVLRRGVPGVDGPAWSFDTRNWEAVEVVHDLGEQRMTWTDQHGDRWVCERVRP